MKRDLNRLSNNTYDVLIIGGGIHGVTAAWDAALRGLSVALVEKGDFGSATSSNSLKIIHGGLRYLQQADFRRMRESIRDRMILMRIAPHLVHPLPCVMPTYGHFIKGREVMSIALAINDLVGFDRNQLEDPEKYIPRGRIISKSECLRLIPGVNEKGLTGGAIWYDCQMYNSERLTLSFVLSAAKAGADVANYVEVIGFLRDGNRITGVKAKDVLTGEKLEIRAKIVVNNSGPWVDQVLGLLNTSRDHRILWSKAMNLVTRQLIPKYAVGLPGKVKVKNGDVIVNKVYFIAPWRNFSLVGTVHAPYYGNPNDYRVSEEEIQNFIDEINQAYPGAALKREDVLFFYGGLLPMDGENRVGEVKLTRHCRIYDHQKENGIEGLISVVGVKYTTARNVAEKTIDLVVEKLGRKPLRSATAVTPLHGGHIERFGDFLSQETNRRPKGLDKEIIRHLIYNYGSEYHQILKYIDEDPQWGQPIAEGSQVIKAEVLHGIREEMAQKLGDVIFRRTELGSAGDPGEECIKTCAEVMAAELGWDEGRKQGEIEEVRRRFVPKYIR